jgi:hypothetical protein
LDAIESWIDRFRFQWLLLVTLLVVFQAIVADSMRYTLLGGVPGLVGALVGGLVVVVRARRRAVPYIGWLSASLLVGSALYYEISQQPYQRGQVVVGVLAIVMLIVAMWRTDFLK